MAVGNAEIGLFTSNLSCLDSYLIYFAIFCFLNCQKSKSGWISRHQNLIKGTNTCQCFKAFKDDYR